FRLIDSMNTIESSPEPVAAMVAARPRTGGRTMTSGYALSGGCLCGAVRFEARAAEAKVVNCHCGQCRRFHGHCGAYVTLKDDDFRLARKDGLAWYESSPKARRGFCRLCGSSLFWQGFGRNEIDVAAGAL